MNNINNSDNLNNVINIKKVNNGKVRAITFIILILFSVAVMWIGGWAPSVLVLLFMGIAAFEMFNAFKSIHIKCVRYPSYIYVALMPSAYHYFGLIGVVVLFLVCVLLSLVHVVFSKTRSIYDGVYSVFTLVYPCLVMSCLYFLTRFKDYNMVLASIIASVLCSVATDTCAYLFGSRFGKHKLIPAISPKKTIEGSIAGFAGSLLVGIIMIFVSQSVFPDIHPINFFFLSIGVGIFAQVGDLIASAIKRYCKIKDYGNIFPGHGGVLDRMDSIIPSSIFAFLIFKLIIGVN